MKYPCKLCLVRACCSIYCNDYYDFINYWSDNLPKVTADEIHEFRINTPLKVRRRVENFLGKRKRYDYNVRYKNFVAVTDRDNYWNYQKRGTRSES